MTDRPGVVVFDVNETLSDLAPLADRFVEVGAPGHLASTWFASVLRDGFGRTAAGAPAPFADVAAGVLRTVLAGAGVPSLDAAVASVMTAFTSLAVHPDVPDGVRALHSAGLRLVTLTNGSVDVSAGLLGRAGIRREFEQLLSVEDAGAWKPARAAYEYAVRQCAASPGDLLLVAVHPWNIDGAARAGLRTAWVDRERSPYPAHLTPPELTVSGIDDLARRLDG